MSARRVVVVEANEIPPRVIRWYVDERPASVLARLVRSGGWIETENLDEPDLERHLYPSQAWATLATGVGFAQHRVYWYGDPKPAEYPLYWQLAAQAGKRVGIVGTLHSSPLLEQANHPNIAFAIPDCFASEPDTRPYRYRSFQQMNLAMTRRSGRVASTKPKLRDVAALAMTPALGVRPRAAIELAKLGSQIAARKAPRERIRVAQFVLMSDMFMRLVRRHDPDLAVMFTNHVAAAMHRYWAALFPDDWQTAPYDRAWIDRHSGEVLYAMDTLDRRLGDLVEVCDATDRVLMLCTAIGQRADLDVGAAASTVAVVRDAERFLAALGIPDQFEVRAAMVPQIGLLFAEEGAATRAFRHLNRLATGDLSLEVNQAANVVTITYSFAGGRQTFAVAGNEIAFDDAGVAVERTDVQRCAVHDRIGSLVIHGANPSTSPARVDVRSFAPAVLELLGVEPPEWHHVRQLRLTESVLASR